jgi:hypothetical protein
MFRGFSLFRSSGSGDRQSASPGAGLKYCVQCGDEYRAEFSRCAVCDCELVPVARKRAEASGDERSRDENDLHISAEDELLIMRRGNLAEMKNVQRLLKNKFVGSMLAEDHSGQAAGCCNSKIFNVSVKKADADFVQQILADDFKRTTALDDHDFQHGAEAVFDQRSSLARCPACGCSFQPEDRACPECGLCF